MMEELCSELVLPQLKAVNDTLNLLKANQDQIDDKTMVWQRKLEHKLDQLLKHANPASQQLVRTPLTAIGQSTQIPGVVQPAWSDCADSSTRCPEVGSETVSTGDLVKSPLLSGGQTGEVDEVCTIRVKSSEASLEEIMNCSPNGVQSQSHSLQVGDTATDYLSGKTTYQSATRKSAPLPVFDASLQKKIKTGTLPKPTKTCFFNSTDKKKKKGRGQNAQAFVLSKKRQDLIDTQTWLYRFTTAKGYEVGVLVLIILNSLFIGWQVQVVAYRVEDSFNLGTPYQTKPPVGFFVVQTVFSIVFVVELSLRWIGEGFLEFISFSPDLWWNLFDIATVTSGVVDFMIELCSSDSTTVSSISTIRVLRVLRVVRLLKLIRTYPFFHELRMMVESCLNSLKSYMWCVLVILLLTYLFAISMTTGACTYLSDEEKYNTNDLTDQSSARVQMFFGTLDRSMLSLFQTIAGGRDWFEFWDVIVLLDFTKKWFYLLYISFTIFAVCNVVAAVFVESAMQSSAHDRELLIREQLKDSQDYCRKMMSVFEEMDEDGTGTISEEEFLSHLDDDRVKAYFNSMKLDVSDAASLFKLLDVDRSGSVEIMEFIEGCQKLKGESRTLDMHLMRYELHSLRHELHDLCLKFFKYAEVKGVAYLKDMRLASTENLDSPTQRNSLRSLRKAASLLREGMQRESKDHIALRSVSQEYS